jgi:thioredoxin reductase (NADPH)
MVVREDSLKAYMSDYLIDRIRHEPKVNVLTNNEVTALHGDRTLQAITLRSNKPARNGQRRRVGSFSASGARRRRNGRRKRASSAIAAVI